MRRLLFFLGLSGCVVSASGFGCSCNFSPLQAAVKDPTKAAVVFAGVFEKAEARYADETLKGPDMVLSEYALRFRVTEAWQGVTSSSFRMSTPAKSKCAVAGLVEQQSYLVISLQSSGPFLICNTQTAKATPENLKAIAAKLGPAKRL